MRNLKEMTLEELVDLSIDTILNGKPTFGLFETMACWKRYEHELFLSISLGLYLRISKNSEFITFDMTNIKGNKEKLRLFTILKYKTPPKLFAQWTRNGLSHCNSDRNARVI
ncbi:MAG: hypothetical protein ACTSU7_02870 [Candidatus Heimdallarchaeaceae archaeon]